MHASIFRSLTLGFSAALAFSACGSSDTGGTPADGNKDAGGTPAAGIKANGLFEIHYKADVTSSISEAGGFMYDGPLPEMVVWGKKKTDGDCSLYTPSTPFCESCNPGEVCVATNVCQAQPLTHNVGDMTMTGLTPSSGAGPISLYKVEPTAGAETGVSYACTASLPVPPCVPGSSVGLAATGGAIYPAFSIQAQCIAPLAVTTTSMTLESGKPFSLAWTPGSVTGTRIKVEFDLSHHGGSKGRVLCDTADKGSLLVSSALLESLIALGVTGFPSIAVARELASTTPVGSGQAQLKIYSDANYTAQMPDLISCQNNGDCPAGQTCLDPGMMCGIACKSNADCPTGQTCLSTTKNCK
jgi:hypothetical protein